MKVIDNRTTRKDNNKNQKTNIIYDQNSNITKSIINKIKLASDKNQNNLTGTSLENIWDLSLLRLVTGRQ